MLQTAIDSCRDAVNGVVRVKLYKGNVTITGRKSPNSLYNADLVTFEEGAIDYDHSDANGFIRLNALRLRVNKMVQNK
jgi:argininosuccinate synthase